MLQNRFFVEMTRGDQGPLTDILRIDILVSLKISQNGHSNFFQRGCGIYLHNYFDALEQNHITTVRVRASTTEGLVGLRRLITSQGREQSTKIIFDIFIIAHCVQKFENYRLQKWIVDAVAVVLCAIGDAQLFEKFHESLCVVFKMFF
jgi:hypothetical protein